MFGHSTGWKFHFPSVGLKTTLYAIENACSGSTNPSSEIARPGIECIMFMHLRALYARAHANQ